ncbi:MAG: hypothetical protein AB7U24_06535 [Sulfurimonadaceae bacterium]
MAIVVIVVITTIMALSLSLTVQTAKKTTDIYLHEQITLLAKSAAEYSLFKIAEDGPCTHHNDLNFQHNGMYDINITNRYIYTNPNPCLGTANFGSYTNPAPLSPDTNGTVIMDITISVDDPTITSEPIRYFRRTIQKL